MLRDLNDTARDWAPPEELRTSPPRSVRVGAGGIVIMVVAVACMAGGILLGLRLQETQEREAQTSGLLAEQGQETEGTVIRVWRGGGKNRTYLVSYRFTAGDRVIHGQSQAPRRIWEGLTEGSRMRVRYALTDPNLNHPTEWEASQSPPWLVWALPMVFAAISLFIMWCLRRQKRLLEDGRVAPGVITRVRKVKGGRSVAYDFLLPGGVKSSGSGMLRQGLAEEGGTVTVVYDPDNPGRNAPYPFDLVRPAQER